MTALLRKELRAGWILALLAFLSQAWVAYCLFVDFDLRILKSFDLFDSWQAQEAFQKANHAEYPGAIALVLGLALGVLQAFPETVQGTTPLLIHVAGTRRRVVHAKLLAGALLYLGALLPVAIAIPAAAARAGLGIGDLGYFWILLGVGLVAYVGTLACFLRGHRGRVQGHFQQIAIAFLLLVLLVAVTMINAPLPALLLLLVAGGFALAATYAGFEARTF